MLFVIDFAVVATLPKWHRVDAAEAAKEMSFNSYRGVVKPSLFDTVAPGLRGGGFVPRAKVLINTQLGTVELEGEDSFVRTYLDVLIPIIEQAGLGSGSAVQATGDPSTDEAGRLAKPRIRQRRPQTPGGKSCRDRIRELRDEGFFAEQRGISDIVGGLNTSGHPHNINQVGAALTTMFERNEILRTPVMGKFKYHWVAEERSAAPRNVING